MTDETTDAPEPCVCDENKTCNSCSVEIVYKFIDDINSTEARKVEKAFMPLLYDFAKEHTLSPEKALAGITRMIMRVFLSQKADIAKSLQRLGILLQILGASSPMAVLEDKEKGEPS
jgi:hypothetical protein